MPLARLRQKTNVSGQRYVRPVTMSINMAEGSQPGVAVTFEDVVDIAGERRPIRRIEQHITLIEDDILGADGVTVAVPNNLGTTIDILNQTTGQVESTITYADAFKILASFAAHVRANGT